MSATLNVVNNFSIASQGVTSTGRQGLATSNFSDQYGVTVTGLVDGGTPGQLATASVVTLFDSNSRLQTWVYAFLWVDQIAYLQLIGSATNAVLKVAPYQPFVLPGYQLVLAAANTTPIAGGAEPSLTTISKVVLGNYSGTTLNYVWSAVK